MVSVGDILHAPDPYYGPGSPEQVIGCPHCGHHELEIVAQHIPWDTIPSERDLPPFMVWAKCSACGKKSCWDTEYGGRLEAVEKAFPKPHL